MLKSHLRYLRYVLRHKWFVFLYCLEYGLFWRGIKHDWTKFLPSEWRAYVAFFYGGGLSREEAERLGFQFSVAPAVEIAFEYGWNFHQKRNDHHWQFWLRIGDDGTLFALPMPEACRWEMLADWRGAGRALGKPLIWEWYAAHKDRMRLHPITRMHVEVELARLEHAYHAEMKRLTLGL